MTIPFLEDNDQTLARKEHLEKLRELVGNVYPNKFSRTKISGVEDTISNILHFETVIEIVNKIKEHIKTLNEGERPNPEIKEALNAELKALGNVRISGRLATPPRTMGKAAFVHLSDGKNRLQVYIRRDDIKGIFNGSSNPKSEIENPKSVDGWEMFKLCDHGDFIGVEGFLFITNTGELSVHVETLQFLSKAMLPMPDKIHGIADPEIQRRYRYADLIADSLKIDHDALTTREVFEIRARVISGMRRFLDDDGYIEVETPMLTPKATGAAARPFATHHNALDIPLYARIAPELYLKRLTVGGFEKVYELNRNFRNEGISQKHNPEFTMLEFYCAYMDVNGMMDFCEKLLQESVMKATGSLVVNYNGKKIDFGSFARVDREINLQKKNDNEDIDSDEQVNSFQRYSMKDAVYQMSQEATGIFPEGFDRDWLDDDEKIIALADFTNFFQYERNIVIFVGYEDGEFRTKTFDQRRDKDEISRYDDSNYWNRAAIHQTGGEELLQALWEANHERAKLKDISDAEVGTALEAIKSYFEEELGKKVEETWDGSYSRARERNILSDDVAKGIETVFERIAEANLIQPTFIIDYPKSISPLSKASPDNPNIAERFELFINGMECANGFSELNDPQEQYERFLDQGNAREKGDDEAMVMDEDYIRALSYGMPPAAGIGIGIDRLVMLLTNRQSIRDVILFPHMRPIVKAQEEKIEE